MTPAWHALLQFAKVLAASRAGRVRFALMDRDSDLAMVAAAHKTHFERESILRAELLRTYRACIAADAAAGRNADSVYAVVDLGVNDFRDLAIELFGEGQVRNFLISRQPVADGGVRCRPIFALLGRVKYREAAEALLSQFPGLLDELRAAPTRDEILAVVAGFNGIEAYRLPVPLP